MLFLNSTNVTLLLSTISVGYAKNGKWIKAGRFLADVIGEMKRGMVKFWIKNDLKILKFEKTKIEVDNHLKFNICICLSVICICYVNSPFSLFVFSIIFSKLSFFSLFFVFFDFSFLIAFFLNFFLLTISAISLFKNLKYKNQISILSHLYLFFLSLSQSYSPSLFFFFRTFSLFILIFCCNKILFIFSISTLFVR